MISNLNIKSIIDESFRDAYHELNHIEEEIKTINKKRSSKFITEVGTRLQKYYEQLGLHYHLNYQKYINKDSRKKPGEWLYDVSITEQESIYDLEKTNAEIKINTKLIWAIESESNVGLDCFAKDFGKLLCANSQNYLYLNGLNQSNKEYQSYYVLRRLSIVSKLLEKNNFFDTKVFYYCFWVSPEKKDGKSLWEKFELNELIDMIRVFKYTNDTEEFIKSDIHFYEI
jgi:hypothetical protein